MWYEVANKSKSYFHRRDGITVMIESSSKKRQKIINHFDCIGVDRRKKLRKPDHSDSRVITRAQSPCHAVA